MKLEELLKVLGFPIEIIVRDADTGLRTDALSVEDYHNNGARAAYQLSSVLTKRVKLVYQEQEVGKLGVQPTIFIDVEEKSPCESST